MGAYLPEGIEVINAQPIIDIYEGLLADDVENYYRDYYDVLQYNSLDTLHFTLKYKPVISTLKFLVQGVLYQRNVDYVFDAETNKITWMSKPSTYEGDDWFYPNALHNITAIYDINYVANNITDPSSIV